MKKAITLILVLLMLPLLNSCGTIYTAAVDERSIGTIASDHEIKASILAKFADDEQVGVLDFSVSSYNGHVYLIGEYETQTQKNRAIELAKSQKGVNGITTYLLKENPKARCGYGQNMELTAKVKAKLIGDKDIWSTNVDVKTMQCITVVWGLVGSQIEIDKVLTHAKSVEGITKVKSFLKSVS